MSITIATATATARTELAAFDRALVAVGAEAWAGVGRVQDECTGGGLFVEHEGGSEDEVRSLICDGLADLQVSRGIDLGAPRMPVTGIRCEGDPGFIAVRRALDDAWSGTTSGIATWPDRATVRRGADGERPG